MIAEVTNKAMLQLETMGCVQNYKPKKNNNWKGTVMSALDVNNSERELSRSEYSREAHR